VEIPFLDSRFKKKIIMSRPGEYVTDVTEGITHPDDLPKPKIRNCNYNFKKRPCPDFLPKTSLSDVMGMGQGIVLFTKIPPGFS